MGINHILEGGDATLYPLYFQVYQGGCMHTLETLTFHIYIWGTFWQNFMALGSCSQNLWQFGDGTLHEES